MTPGMVFRIAWKALLRNKLRSLLTMLGIIIGVAAVIAMLSIGNGAQAAITDSINKMGTNTVEISPGSRRGPERGDEKAQRVLVEADWYTVSGLPGILAGSPVTQTMSTLVYGRANWNTRVVGVGEQYPEVTSWPMESGRMFNPTELRGSQNVVVLGQEVRKELFGAADPIGETVRIGTFPFKVIGLLSEKGSSGGWMSEDNRVLVPFTTANDKVLGRDRLNNIVLKAVDPGQVDDLGVMATALLNSKYHIEDDSGFQAETSAQANETAAASVKMFSYLLGGVASVSLLVGGIGIMNIMLVSVTERIREIGIRMAIGARGRDILAQFLVESIVLSLIGGALGIVLGVSISAKVAGLAGWPTIVSKSSILLAFGTSAFIGVFFGFYPALSASRLDPIEALRSD